MRRRTSRASRRLIAAAVVVAAVGGVTFRNYAAALEREARPGGPPRPVVVAAADLGRGSTIGPDDVGVVHIPRGFVAPGALGSAKSAIGRSLLAPIDRGEPLTESRLGPIAGPVASLVPPGLRAVAVTTALPRGSVREGDEVDVLATFATGQPHTETIVEGAEILSVLTGDAATAADVAGITLMLLVSPSDAERLAYARAFADLSVAIAPP